MPKPLRILFSTPAFWPAEAFGGPIPVLRELAGGLVRAGDTVSVLTTSLADVTKGRSLRTVTAAVDGAEVAYLATPARSGWMGFTPSLPLHLARLPQPDIVHVFGFRDPLGTAIATWARARRIPYVLEALGMFEPKLRKVGLKRALDATVLRGVAGSARLFVAVSERERREYLGAGLDAQRVRVRPNGFPQPAGGLLRGALRSQLGLTAETPLVLSVGRIARGKGLDLLVRAIVDLPGAHLAFVGPDAGHGMTAELLRLRESTGTTDRVHLLGAVTGGPPFALFADADVAALVSENENFGMVAAEAAAVGTAVIVSDRSGVAELLAGAAEIVPYEVGAVRVALARLLDDPALRSRLGAAARAVAERHSWPEMVAVQKAIYLEALGVV